MCIRDRSCGVHIFTDNFLSRFVTIHAFDRQTGGLTDVDRKTVCMLRSRTVKTTIIAKHPTLDNNAFCLFLLFSEHHTQEFFACSFVNNLATVFYLRFFLLIK